MMGKWVHRLSSIDVPNASAICANCGLVKITMKDGVWKCNIARLMGKMDRSPSDRRRTKAVKNGFREPPIGCEICGAEEKLSLDHDHATEELRGWLCHTCNVGLGMFHDNESDLLAAMKYLQKSRSPKTAAFL